MSARSTSIKKRRHSASPPEREVRYRVSDLQVQTRSKADTDELVVRGSVVVYDTPYSVHDRYGEFSETMAQGVATDCSKRGVDTRLLVNHEGLPLARTTSGTMKLIDTPRALNIEARLDARMQLANDLYLAIERRDVSAMSVGFRVAAPDGDVWNDDFTERTVLRFADIADCSAVTFPASPTTSISAVQRAGAVPVEARARLRAIHRAVRAGRFDSEQFVAALGGALGDADDRPATRQPQASTKVLKAQVERAQRARRKNTAAELQQRLAAAKRRKPML